MAHQLTREEVDQLAATEAASITTQAEASASSGVPETTLAYGAQGECVTKLVDLLAVLGYSTNSVIKGGPPIIDETVLADLRMAQGELGVTEPEVTLPAEIPVGVKGELVGTTTWNALYAAAEQKLGGQASASAGGDGSGAISA
jgi:hypothetical protein